MNHKNVIIRTVEQLKTSKKEIVTALLKEANSKKKDTFPVYYKYLEERRPKGSLRIPRPDESQQIGTISNIHKANNGDIVATVCTNDALSITGNFTGVIDNIVVALVADKTANGNKSHIESKISYGIVYDKFAKKVMDDTKNAKASMTQLDPSPKSDYVATDSDYNPLKDPNVMNEVQKELSKELGGQL